MQTAMKLVLEPIFEADFHDCSYGYGRKRDAKHGVRGDSRRPVRRAWGVVEIDFKATSRDSAPQAAEADHAADCRWQDAAPDQTEPERRGLDQGRCYQQR